MNAISVKMASIGKGMTIVGGVITAISVGLVKMASDAEETGSKFAVVFQDVADEAAKSAKNLSDNFGLSTNAAKQLLSDTGDLLTGFGFTGKAALDLSTKVNELAVDLASFTNYSGGAEGASVALTKALLGERESVKSLGISILETDVKAKVLEMTQKGMTFETERQAKAYATLLIAQEQSKNAIGDYSRTSEGFANQMRELKARLNDVGVMLGEMILPIATKLINKTVKIIEKIKEWVEAHKPLVEIIVKVGAILGALAAVGGPILLAISAFMKMKIAITAVSVAVKALAISSGPIGWLILAAGALFLAWQTNFGGIRDFTIAVVDKVTEALGWLWDKVKWVLEKLGLYKEKVKEAGEGAIFSAEKTKALAEKVKEAGEEAETAAPKVDTLATSMDGLGEKTETAKDVMDEFGNFLETFEEWTARLAKEEVKRQTAATKKLKEEADKRKSILEKLAEAQKSMADRMYELTHTAMEVNIKKLDEQKQSYLDLGVSIKEVNTWYDEEIAKLNEANQAKDVVIDKNEEIVESNKEVAKSSKEVEIAADMAGDVSKESGERGIESWEDLIIVIKKATVSLSNFTAEGIAAAIANIKMKFLPTIMQLTEDLSNIGAGLYSGFFRAMTQMNIDTLKKQMNEQIATIFSGYEEYQNILAGLNNGGGSVGGFTTSSPSFNSGGDSTSNQSTTNNNSWSPSIVVNVAGDGNASEIREAVEQALQESTRQFNRSGNVLIPGMA